MKPFTYLLNLRPVVFNHNFNMTDYLDVTKLVDFINADKSGYYALGSLGEYAFAVWMREFFLYPDIVPNDDKFKTDLNYKKINSNLTNFHIKTTDTSKYSNITGLVNIKTKSGNDNYEPLIFDKTVIENDVIAFVGYNTTTHDVKIYSTVPANIAKKHFWKEPIIKEFHGKKLAIYNEDVVDYKDTILFRELFNSKPEKVIPSVDYFKK